MEKEGARLFQHETNSDKRNNQNGWNIVELEVLESRRQLRQKVNELIGLCNSSTLTTSEIRHQMLLGVTSFGDQLATQLVRSLLCDDLQKRQNIVWLLTVLHDASTIPPLQRIALNTRLSRSIRLSAALALAGIGATAELRENIPTRQIYAIS
ncbi:MAG TPA: hypothetical protein VKR42_10515 [Ktedonobacteraceae bacterium]|nr:hypothetical protein [Ktedonobacteraceae bacterium]